jgi:hypothetical protein
VVFFTVAHPLNFGNMKYFILMMLFVTSLKATSQKSHSEILNMTKEIKIIDRLYLDLTNLDKKEIDQATAYKLFNRMYGNNSSLPGDTKYYIAGKITRNPGFDLLFLYAEENKTESVTNFNLSLLTTRKDGSYVSVLDAASDIYYVRKNKTEFHKTRSYLYSDLQIRQENEISTPGRKYEMEYKINDYGVFVFYPN